MSAFGAGAALFLGIVFLTAGGLKVCVPHPFQHAVYRLLPDRWASRRTVAVVAAPLVGSFELLVGTGLVAAPLFGRALFLLSAVLGAASCLCFVAVVAYAIRVGSSCGCFASFSDGPAGPVELGRSLFLAAVSLAVLAIAPSFKEVNSWRWSIALWAAICLVGLAAWVAVADRIFNSDAVTTGRVGLARLLPAAGGRVRSRLGDEPLPRERSLSPDETSRLTSMASASPAVLAFSEWLGERASEIDWMPPTATATTDFGGGGRAVTTAQFTPTTPTSMHVEVFVPLGAGARGQSNGGAPLVMVVALVDGVTVVADNRGVRTGSDHDRRRLGSRPS